MDTYVVKHLKGFGAWLVHGADNSAATSSQLLQYGDALIGWVAVQTTSKYYMVTLAADNNSKLHNR